MVIQIQYKMITIKIIMSVILVIAVLLIVNVIDMHLMESRLSAQDAMCKIAKIMYKQIKHNVQVN